jgi:hypothetical protein
MLKALREFQAAVAARQRDDEPFATKDKDISSYTNTVVDAAMKLDGKTHDTKEFYKAGAALVDALAEVFQQSSDSAIHDDLKAVAKKVAQRSENYG